MGTNSRCCSSGPRSPTLVPWLAVLAVLAVALVGRTEAKCQIVCHQRGSANGPCDDAEVKCANNLPEGYYCLEFSDSRPPVCLHMVPDAEKPSSPRPRRYKPFIEYNVGKAPDIVLLD